MNERAALYRRQIETAVPNLTIESWQSNSEGLVNDVIIVNGSHIFRFPKYDWAVDHLRHEAKCLELARPFLDMPLPQWTIYEGEITGAPFVGYARIPGTALARHTLLRLPHADQQALAEQIGVMLRQMHAIPVEKAKAAGIGRSVTTRGRDDWLRLYADVQEKLFPHLMAFAREWVDEQFVPVVANPDFMAYTPVFMNGDLGGYHLLYNSRTRRLNGVIDFGAAGLGDPAADFACLLDQFGESFVRRMTAVYPGIDALIDRARFWAGTLQLQWALGGLRDPDDPSWFFVHIGRARDVNPIGSGWRAAGGE